MKKIVSPLHNNKGKDKISLSQKSKGMMYLYAVILNKMMTKEKC